MSESTGRYMSVLYPELILSEDNTLCTPGTGPSALLLMAGEDRALPVPDIKDKVNIIIECNFSLIHLIPLANGALPDAPLSNQ